MTSTLTVDTPLGRVRRARTVRRVFFVLLFAFIGLALAGVFGVRTGTASKQAEGYELEVTYARVTRPGLATPWSVTIRHRGGFDGPVTIGVSSDYFEIFDENGLDPDPAKSWADAGTTFWSFDPPDGNEMEISFDARTEPARQWGQDGYVRLMDGDRTRIRVNFKTWIVP